ncbi:MAG: TonB-dependent receptor [Gammaproteobacteria bacterium]|nr:TonB-dependent receptor [Gammaproteobacteria bacterium]
MRFKSRSYWFASSLLLGMLAGSAFADDVPDKSDDGEQEDESQTTSQSHASLEEVKVVAHPLSKAGVRAIGDIDVVSIERNNLDRSRAENLADVVATVPGARNASFGPGVSHPVIHGLDGPRILVLYDRLRPMDVATYPGDHPPLVDPFFATQIEVLKGPNTLLFGSGSSGGVINTETGRIANELPAEPSIYSFEVRTRDNGNRAFAAGRADFRFEDFVLHFDGYSRQADSYDIPGCAISDRMMHHLEEEEMHADEPHEEDHEENECGTLPNSDIENQGGSLGLTLVRDWGYAGLSVSSSRAVFGIPVEHAHHEEEHHDDEHEDPHEEDHDEEHEEPHDEEHEHEHGEAERVNIDLDYSRIDWELGLTSPFEFVDELTWRLGFSDYIHDELVEGVAETTFERGDAIDSRLVFTTEEINDWTHAFGGNFNRSEFVFSSEGVATDPITTSSTGVFWLGHTERDEIDYQVGVRLENVTVDFAPVGDKKFTLLNFSGGLARTLQPGLTFDASFDYSSRAPVGDELYVEGLHVAIGSHLEPNPNLDVENIHALNASVQYVEGKFRANVTGYMRWADGYIYGTPTGEVEDELPVLQYTQEDASFIGSDIYMDYLLYEENGWLVETLLGYDFVRAKVDLPGNDALPRAPADRIRGGIEAHRGSLTLAGMIEYYAEVDDTADNILPTDAYTDVKLDVEYTFDLADRRAKVFLQVKNLLDAERRPHSSPVKDQVPLPGRSFAVGFNIHN